MKKAAEEKSAGTCTVARVQAVPAARAAGLPGSELDGPAEALRSMRSV
jgi:hypothetical protein